MSKDKTEPSPAEKHGQRESKTCEWECYSGYWFKTKCGGRSTNPPNYKFCPFCGGKIHDAAHRGDSVEVK